MIRKRQLPLAGKGTGVWSFVHIDDAASATVAALEHGTRGIYNVVDDDPAPISEWLPVLAQAIGAKPPRHVRRGRPAVRRRGGGRHDDRVARVVERQG